MSSATNVMKDKEELNEFEKFAKAHITVVKERPFELDENCPFLVKKLEDAYKTFEEAPLPEYLIKWQNGED